MPAHVKTLSGDTSTFSDEQLDELRMGFRGPLVTPADTGYDETRVVHNMHIDRRPGLVIRCAGTADVVDAVNLARERGLLTAVRGGGHSVAGHSVCDDGLMIDLSALRGVWVDAGNHVVRVQGGATWGDVDRETQLFGLVAPGGIVSTTGVGGLTLGGGLGWLHRKWGLACDNLRAAEIVTADGRLRRASPTEHEDLFWALRGGGGNYGVVTAFEFDAHDLGPIVFAAIAFYPVENADGVFRAWREWSAGVPDEVTTRAVFWTGPENPHMPPEVHNRQVLIVGAVYAGSPEDGAVAVEPARRFGTPLADLSGELPFRGVQAAFDPFFPKGEVGNYWKSLYLDDLNDDVTDMIVKYGVGRQSPMTLLHVPLMGGAVSRPGPADTAVGDRSAPYMLSVDGNWLDPADADGEIAWVREVIRETERFSNGMPYLNFSGDEPDNRDLVQAAFGDNLSRLRDIKTTYDPQNLFRLNNNITPT